MKLPKINAVNRLLGAAICFVLFLQTIIMVLFFDVQPIGPAGTSIGCATMNKAFQNMIGTSVFLYDLTTYLGILAILAVAVFAAMGLSQLINRRSLIKVDNEILIMGGLYLLIFLLYAFFEIVVVNTRPVLMPGEVYPEASFPSSHAVLIIVVMGSVFLVIGRFVRNRTWKTIIQVLCAIVFVVTYLGRLFCGAHWLTDIMGGTFISAALLLMFSGLIEKYPGRL